MNQRVLYKLQEFRVRGEKKERGGRKVREGHFFTIGGSQTELVFQYCVYEGHNLVVRLSCTCFVDYVRGINLPVATPDSTRVLGRSVG